ncbi:Sec7-domain-containing protein, partial [Martensiomyces pterosporus]
MACNPQNSAATNVVALDCIEKLVSFHYFDNVVDLPNAASQLRLSYFRGIADRLVTIVSRCLMGEGTADNVQLQIVKALFALISSETLPVRQSSMLTTIRTAYNVFVLAKNPGNQTIAQGTLTQMVHLVLSRVPVELDESEDDSEAENTASADDEPGREGSTPSLAGGSRHGSDARRQANDGAARDAFLLLRALCKMSMRPMANDHALDSRSPQLRSRSLALNLIRLALAEHTAVLASSYVYLRSCDGQSDKSPPTVAVPLIAVIRQYLSLSLSRNLVSSNAMILDLGLAVFELTMFHMRMYLRREMEVIFREILLPVLESKSSGSLHQRGRVLQTLARLLGQPALVVELYLNYDCAEDSRANVFQRLAEILCKLGGNYVAPPHKNSQHYWLGSASAESSSDGAAMVAAAWRAVQQKQTVFNTPLTQILQSAGLLSAIEATSAAAANASNPARLQALTPTTPDKLNGAAVVDEYMVRQWALDALVAMLQSMVVWSDRLAGPGASAASASGTGASDEGADGRESSLGPGRSGSLQLGQEPSAGLHEGATDDPEELSSIKHRKEQFEAARKLFAWKPKKGVEAWKSGGFIKSNDPRDVAKFFFTSTSQGVDKMQLGEYLGEGDAYNIAVMHAFVDCMNFADMEFVAALRLFLQAFRLPGESQKIDRFMLKFAERYLMGNPNAGFANADAAYVLAYSTIMLNTDQHSPQVKNRMTKQEFINNNRGINDGKNLEPEFLTRIFDHIVVDEIKLKDDPLEGKIGDGDGEAQGSGPLFDLWGNSTANRIREQHAHASAAMAAKSEQSIRSMAKLRRKRGAASLATLDTWAMLLDMTDFLHATRADHIAPMFGTIWTALLAALSSPMQTASDPHVIAACLVGFQSGIALACRFRMPLERAAFVTTLRNFTQLQNLAEMKRKHVEAIRALIEVAASRPDVGGGLAENWLDVLQCVSQLERLQLLTQGSEAAGPHRAGRNSTTQGTNVQVPSVSVAELAKLGTNSQVLVVMVDRLFTSSVHLSGSGIVDFVRALSQVAWSEITSTFRRGRRGSLVAQAPPAAPSRLFSLTKIVEISYYNMERIRVEWSQIWAILGPLFDRVGAYSDTRAALFALDSLRQLSMKFLEKEELPHFAFQKEFLRPFADILEGFIPDAKTDSRNSGPAATTVVVVDVLVKDMVLRCVRQLVQAASFHIRSGWKAILNVAQIAARDANDSIAEMGFFLAKECAELHGPHMWMLTTAHYFHELIDCLNEYAVGAATRRPRLALNAIDVLHLAAVTLGKQILDHPDFSHSDGIPLDDQPLYRVWMPALRALHEVVMHTEDLEVRTRALDSFFRMIMSQGKNFSAGLWTSVLRDLVFTMFADLRDPSASKRFATVDDLELWFSTTLIKALRHLIALFTRYYPQQLPGGMMAEVLELLTMCIAQPSEVLGKIGTSCLQDLVRNNYTKWDDEAWGLVCDTFVRLFNWSQPRELFSIAGASAPSNSLPRANSAASASAGEESSADYLHITLKCILQLLLIQTLGELFGKRDGDLYEHMSAHHLFILLDCLDQSRAFAHRFNRDRKVRRRLVEMGVMPTMPSLLKQETSSVLTELHILQRMNADAIGV